MKITDLATIRTHLKQMTESDYTDMKEYLTDEYAMRFFDHGVMSEEMIQDFLTRGNRVFPIILNSENKIIGHIFLGEWFAKDTYEIGWVLNKNYHKKGIMTEVAEAVMEYAFANMNAHRIVATCQPENIASKRICEKLNMRLEGEFKKCIYIERLDEWWDELFFAILKEEYIERKNKDV